jgi:hypothetical protein
MFVIARDCLSEPAELRKDRIIQPIVRKAVSLGKSLGPILYLVTVGVIATWVIGVFFGVGFFLLMHHHSEKTPPSWVWTAAISVYHRWRPRGHSGQ